jgi:trafficking protein particle complex subunit 3
MASAATSSTTTGGSSGGSNKAAAIATGNALWNRVPKANAELFALTYGALVTEVLRDYGEDVAAVNEQLDKMGHSMGVRCVDEYLAKLSTAAPPCSNFLDTAEVLAKSAFKMFLGITADVVIHATSLTTSSTVDGGGEGTTEAGGTEASAPSYSLILHDNPLAIFVELPEQYQGPAAEGQPLLEYNSLYCGLIRGALEMLNMRVECTFVKSTLRGDDVNEIKVQLKEVVAEGAGAEYQEE